MFRQAIERPYLVLLLVALAGVLVFLVSLALPRDDDLVVGSDGIYYFAEVRSLVLDGNLDLTNEYTRLPADQSNPEAPKYTIGLAILWAPFYVLTHLLVGGDGYSDAHQVSVCLATILFGFVGMAATFRLLCVWFGAGASLLATLLVWLATPAVYYMVVEGSLSHVALLMVLTLLLLWWQLGGNRPGWQWWGGMGALCGLAAMVRPQDGAWILVPALALVVTPLASRERLRGAAWLAAGAALAYLPQAIASWDLYGSPLELGYAQHGEEFSYADEPRIPAVLFGLRHGLFLWHWILLAGAIGFFFLMWRRDRRLVWILSVPAVIELYLTASWHQWWAADSFGHRILLNLNPLWAIGLGAAVTWAGGRRVWRIVVPVVVLLALVWNGLFALQYRTDAISKNETISWHDYFVGKLTVLLDLVRGRAQL